MPIRLFTDQRIILIIIVNNLQSLGLLNDESAIQDLFHSGPNPAFSSISSSPALPTHQLRIMRIMALLE